MAHLQFDIEERNWLRNSGWNASKENILLIHGYAGGDDTLPINVLRDGEFVELSEMPGILLKIHLPRSVSPTRRL